MYQSMTTTSACTGVLRLVLSVEHVEHWRNCGLHLSPCFNCGWPWPGLRGKTGERKKSELQDIFDCRIRDLTTDLTIHAIRIQYHSRMARHVTEFLFEQWNQFWSHWSFIYLLDASQLSSIHNLVEKPYGCAFCNRSTLHLKLSRCAGNRFIVWDRIRDVDPDGQMQPLIFPKSNDW